MLSRYTPDLPPAPAVSIIIPAWRCHGVIADALDSAIAQRYTDREIVVVNDGCPETKELEQVLTRYRTHILYMRRPHAGPAAARNAAMDFARGRYLAFLDADDVWSPDFLHRLVPVLDAHREIDVVYSDGHVDGGTGRPRRFMQAFPSRGAATFERVVAGKCTICTTGALVRAARVREILGFDESLGVAEDYDLWLRLLLDGARFTYLREPLVRARLLPTRICADADRAGRGVLQVLQKLARRHDMPAAHREQLADAIRRLEKALDRARRGANPLRGWMRGTAGLRSET